MAKVGRPRRLTPQLWMDTALALATVEDSPISKKLKVNYSTVYRVRKAIIDSSKLKEKFYDPVLKHIEKLSEMEYTRDLDNWEVFKQLRVIKEWEDMIISNRVSKAKRNAYMRSFWHVCKYLKVHPSKVNPEQCADVCKEMKAIYYAGEEQPFGLAYSRIREGMRSFFTLSHRISGEYLSQLGITKESLLGSGKYAKQRVTKEVRHNLVKTLLEYAGNDLEYLDALYADKFMYATATRVTSTLEYNFDMRYELHKNIWMFEVHDKGEKGGTKWEKYLVGKILDDFKEHFSNRFDIEIRHLERELPIVTRNLFPSLLREKGDANDDKLRKLNKKALVDAGLPYKEFPPNHIWRHTFAQDFLSATNWNFELCASLGGWKSTAILKKHYGEMSRESKIDGLHRAMGIEVKKEVKLLEW